MPTNSMLELLVTAFINDTEARATVSIDKIIYA